MKDKWTQLKTINEILAFVAANPQYKHFLDAPLAIHTCDNYKVRNDDWHNEPYVRFSTDHNQLVLETD